MPLIIDDKGNGRFQGERTTVIGCNPRDYSSLLTGGYDTSGILNSRLKAYGSEWIPSDVAWLFAKYRNQEGVYTFDSFVRECPAGVENSCTILIKDTSIFKNFLRKSAGAVPEDPKKERKKLHLPHRIFEDTLLTFESQDIKNIKKAADTDSIKDEKLKKKIKELKKNIVLFSRLFLEKIMVYMDGKRSYVLGEYLLLVLDKETDLVMAFRGYEEFEKIDQLSANRKDNLITELYSRVKRIITDEMLSGNSSEYRLIKDNSDVLAERDSGRPMYDMLVRELEIMREPQTMGEILRSFAENSYSAAHKAFKLLGETDAPLKLYQMEAGNVLKGYKVLPKFELKLSNIPLFIVSELESVQDKFRNQVEKLLGRKYSDKDHKLTSEQISAVESAQAITIVEGGAGTGKSEVLKHRLRFMSENGIDMKKVCVLTCNRISAEMLKKEYEGITAENTVDFLNRRVRKLLDEALDNGMDVTGESRLELFYKAYMESRGQKGVLAEADPEDIDTMLMFINSENIKLEYEHILLDDVQAYTDLLVITLLKIALRNGMSVFLAGDGSYSVRMVKRNIVRPETRLVLYTLEKIFYTCRLNTNFRSCQGIVDIYNNVFRADIKLPALLQPSTSKDLTEEELKSMVVAEPCSLYFIKNGISMSHLEGYISQNIKKGESVAVLAPDLEIVNQLCSALARLFPNNTIYCSCPLKNSGHLYLSKLSEKLEDILYKRREINGFNEFAEIIKMEAVKVNYEIFSGTMNSVDTSVLDWLDKERQNPNRLSIIRNLKDPQKHDTEIRRLKLSMLNFKAENDPRYIKQPEGTSIGNDKKMDITIGLISDSTGLEYDHVVCFVYRPGRLGPKTLADLISREENIGLTRARKSELLMVMGGIFGAGFIRCYEKYVEVLSGEGKMDTE